MTPISIHLLPSPTVLHFRFKSLEIQQPSKDPLQVRKGEGKKNTIFDPKKIQEAPHMASSSISRSPVGFGASWSPKKQLHVLKPVILAFKIDGSRSSGFFTSQESVSTPPDSAKEQRNRSEKKSKKPVKAVAVDDASLCTTDLDYDALAATLESIYKHSPGDLYELEKETTPGNFKRPPRTRKKTKNGDVTTSTTVVRSTGSSRPVRMSLDKRIALKRSKGEALANPEMEREPSEDAVDGLLRDYRTADEGVGSFDWKKMKIPEVLSAKEHTFLFDLMLPMKMIFETKQSLAKDLSREPTDKEMADSMKMSVYDMKRKIEIGLAARNKIIKHNHRLVLFVMNKHFANLGNSPIFDDLCQAGANGLIMGVDRFETKRGYRLSTYAIFWIRHSIIRAITKSNIIRVPFSFETVRQQIQRAKFQLTLELDRAPTSKDIIGRVGISAAKYRNVVKALKPPLSLNKRHKVTQDEYIDLLSDDNAVGGDKSRQQALLRLALDDVLDSLKPKEGMVIRQRFGLDGKGNRSLGEIAGNLNISREMVRKYELKALMKLRHPTRVDYIKKHMS